MPTGTNPRASYGSFAELEVACTAFCTKINERTHREAARLLDQALAEEQAPPPVLPTALHTAALGDSEVVSIVMAEALSAACPVGDHGCHGESDSVRATAQRPVVGAAGTADSAASTGQERADGATAGR
ncbi:hypothetical protein GCM10009767_15760 [Kocuria aegyptia]|uniref:DUF222 domain-containing protein n=1 Tax=Kocuria aegyptia TaxID=330943 RepID=A0ABP4WL29_9MICC